jgi:hypothetical protein
MNGGNRLQLSEAGKTALGEFYPGLINHNQNPTQDKQ